MLLLFRKVVCHGSPTVDFRRNRDSGSYVVIACIWVNGNAFDIMSPARLQRLYIPDLIEHNLIPKI